MHPMSDIKQLIPQLDTLILSINDTCEFHVITFKPDIMPSFNPHQL